MIDLETVLVDIFPKEMVTYSNHFWVKGKHCDMCIFHDVPRGRLIAGRSRDLQIKVFYLADPELYRKIREFYRYGLG